MSEPTPEELEVSLLRLQNERKRHGLFILFLAVVMAGVVAAGVWLLAAFNEEKDARQDATSEVRDLKTAVRAQRQQFLNCQDRPPTANGCADPVTTAGGEPVPGPAGPQGVQGAPGTTGLQGVRGPAGPRGPRGLTGIDGADGLSGASGADGTQGPIGPAGPQGEQGPAGPQGDRGPAGPTCPEGYTAQEVQVEDGSSPTNNDTKTIYACVPNQQ